MNITVQTIGFNSNDGLQSYARKKAEKLLRFHDRIVDVEVFLKQENHSDQANKRIEFKVNIPKDTLFAQREATTFQEGIDECVDVLSRQLKKTKEKMRT